MMEQKKQPVRTFKNGGLRTSVWKNTTENGKLYYSVTPQKRYTKDEGKTWETTHSYSHREAILIADLLIESSRWIRTILEVDKLEQSQRTS